MTEHCGRSPLEPTWDAYRAGLRTAREWPDAGELTREAVLRTLELDYPETDAELLRAMFDAGWNGGHDRAKRD